VLYPFLGCRSPLVCFGVSVAVRFAVFLFVGFCLCLLSLFRLCLLSLGLVLLWWCLVSVGMLLLVLSCFGFVVLLCLCSVVLVVLILILLLAWLPCFVSLVIRAGSLCLVFVKVGMALVGSVRLPTSLLLMMSWRIILLVSMTGNTMVILPLILMSRERAVV